MALDFPASPTNGQAYGSYVYNSIVGAWQSKEDPATVATVSTTAPATGNPGDIWYDSDDGTTYMYYNDGTSAQWVELLSSGLPLLNTKADIAGATFTGNVTAPRFISNQATGTAPFTVASSTAVANLNADLLDGQHATAFSPIAGSSSITTVGTITSGVWNGSAIPVASGGTGATTLTSGGYLKGTGTSAITAQTGVPGTDLTGTVDSARFPAGTIIQTVTASSNTAVAIAPTTYTAITGLSVSITPKRSNSKIIVIASINGNFVGADGGRRSMLTIYRNGSVNLASATGAGTRSLALGGFSNGVSANTYSTVSMTGTDLPGTTAATTYQVYGRIEGTDTMYFNRQSSDVDSALYPRGTSVLTAFEVAV